MRGKIYNLMKKKSCLMKFQKFQTLIENYSCIYWNYHYCICWEYLL